MKANQGKKTRIVSTEGAGLAGTLPTIFNNTILTLLAVTGILHLLLAHSLSSVQFFTFS